MTLILKLKLKLEEPNNHLWRAKLEVSSAVYVVDCDEEIKRRLKTITQLSEENEILKDELVTAKKALFKLADAYKASKESLNSLSCNECSSDLITKLMELNTTLSTSNRELLDAISATKNFAKQLTEGSDYQIELQKLITENEALRKLINLSKLFPKPYHTPSSINGAISEDELSVKMGVKDEE